MYLMKRPIQAVPLAFKAFSLYDEPRQRARALSDLGMFLKEMGHYTPAREAFLLVLDTHPSPEIRINTVLELLELTSLVQDRIGFERWRRELEGRYETLPPDERVDFETKLGAGLAAFGNEREALGRLTTAVRLAEEYSLGQRLFEAEQILAEVREGRQAHTLAAPPSVESDPAPELQEAIDGLVALRTAG
jgi:hypothetical protein